MSAAILLSAALLLLNGFFVAAGFAVIAARRSQVEPAARAGRRSARTALWALEHVPQMLAGAQLGITICSLGLGAVAEPAVVHLIEGPLDRAGLPAGLVHPLAFAIGLGLVVFGHVVVGEMIPKNLTLAVPTRAVLVLAPPLVAFTRVFSVVIRVANLVTAGLLRLVGVEPKAEVTSAYTAQEVQTIVTQSRQEGLLVDDHGLITGAIEFSDRVAQDVMVPLAELTTVAEQSTPADVERLVARTGFSRFPVRQDDEISGYLHLKDLLYVDDAERYEQPIPDKRIRALISVSATDEVESALTAMQRAGSHLARVVDSAGRPVGVVFLEDILEQLVGKVQDATQRHGQR